MKRLINEILGQIRVALRDPAYRWPIIGSVLLHIGFVIVISVRWAEEKEEVQAVVPRHIQATVVDASVLQALKDDRQAKLAEQKQKEKDKQRRIEDKQRKIAEAAAERRRKEVERKKKVADEAARKAEADKKALALKRQQEQTKLDEQARKESEARKRNEEAERNKKELQAAIAAQAEKEKQAELQAERERQLVERMRQAEEEERLRIASELKARQAQAAADRAKAALEESEVARFTGLIKDRLESKWRKPPSARNEMIATLLIRLFPSGDLDRVEIVESSGNNAFDLSALNAATSVDRYPVPQDRDVFEKNFRQFRLAFSPKK
ncbi:MAG: cell envelope integrity protein TolA [Hahellaceae bacterium]|nr:cell envelope integrity protein TolA [Hahellaceae bacterium]